MAPGGKSQGVRVAFPPKPLAAPMSRMFVTDVLQQWHLPDVVQDAEAVATELVSNAAAASAAAGTDVTVGLRVKQGSLFIEVGDLTEILPVLRYPTLEDPRGWGLFLVASMSQRWGTRQQIGGKIIWSELACA